jgi:hypothetical protein
MNLPSTVSTNSKALSAAGPSHYRKSAPPQPNGHRWHWATTAALPIADDDCETLWVRMTEKHGSERGYSPLSEGAGYLLYVSIGPLVSAHLHLESGPQDVRRIWKLAYHSAQTRVGIELEGAGQQTSSM